MRMEALLEKEGIGGLGEQEGDILTNQNLTDIFFTFPVEIV